MIDKKRKMVFLIFLVLFGIISFYLFERMILNSSQYALARYSDSAFIELMQVLIGDNLFLVDGDRVAIDEGALRSKGLTAKTERRVRNSLPFLYAENGKVHFDTQSVSIVNNRLLVDDSVIRGRIFDRNGIILADNIMNETTKGYKRTYSYGPEFYPVIGYWNPVFGKRNLEKIMDDYLTGKLHWPVHASSPEPFKRMQIGDDIALTIDGRIQQHAYKMMDGRKGAVVVLDVETGAILAAVSTPSFDPNTGDRALWRVAFRDDNQKSYENRAFFSLYPPGSTFKTVIASAWIEQNGEHSLKSSKEEMENMHKENFTVFCTGRKNKYVISDIHSHGKVNFAEAFTESCNIFFSEAGVLIGKSILDYTERFGFNREINLVPQMQDFQYNAARSTAFSWIGYQNGKSTSTPFSEIDFRRNPKLVAQGSIGQNLVTATPLQMAIVAATIANKGVMMNPYIIKEIQRGDGKKTLFSAKPVDLERAVKAKTAIEIRRMMEEVMMSGTGKDVKKIYIENNKYTTFAQGQGSVSIRVAGKTGTAEVGDKNGNGKTDPDEKPHSWFIGFAPADNPKIAIAVIAENQGFGSLTAAPIAMDVLAESLNTVNTKRY